MEGESVTLSRQTKQHNKMKKTNSKKHVAAREYMSNTKQERHSRQNGNNNDNNNNNNKNNNKTIFLPI